MNGSQLARERRAWIALASTTGVGDVTFGRLLEVYGSATAALSASLSLAAGHGDRQLAERLGMQVSPGLAGRLRGSAAEPGRTERRMASLGGWTLTPFDAGYPAALSDLQHPPPVLYGLGRAASLLEARMVAVVGTRRPTGLGRDIARRVVTRLAQLRVVVVSGLALGIDAEAHGAALAAGGVTIGVSGAGLQDPAPRPNRRLARAMVSAGGAVVGELPPDSIPSPGTFPRRNRIISALTAGTIVIEAPARSGALITARLALEQGRRVLAAPGRPFDPAVAGCLALLRETPARPLSGLDEMVEDLCLPARSGTVGADEPSTGTLALEGLSPTEREVASLLMRTPQSIDLLVLRTGRSPGEVAAALTLLQVRGWATSHGSLLLPAGALLAASTAPAAAAPAQPAGGAAARGGWG